MDRSDAKRFKCASIKSKKELLRALDSYLLELDNTEYHDIERSRKTPLAELIHCFRNLVKVSDLAFLDNPFERYEVTITDIEVTLTVAKYIELSFDADGYIDSSESVVTPNILFTRAPFVPMEDFATQRGTSPVEVIRWIRKGRIKNVEKRGSDWFAATTQKVFDEEIVDGCFIYKGGGKDLSSVTNLSSETFCWHIFECDDGQIQATEIDSNNRFISRKKISRLTYKEIERGLIASPYTFFQSTQIDRIEEKTPLTIGSNPPLRTSMHQVRKALSFMDLKPETRSILNTVIDELQSEELLLALIDDLCVETELIDKLLSLTEKA